MKERLVTLGLALAALALFYLLFLPKPVPAENAPELPLSSELRPNGYQAAWRWLKSQAIPVTALHERYDRLRADTGGASAAGNVLVTTLPHQLPAHAREAAQLDLWLERGNTAIVLAALDDTPAWSLANANGLVDELGRLTRLKFAVVNAAPPTHRSFTPLLKSLVVPQTSSIEPRGDHPLMEGVKEILVNSEFSASRWRATPMDRAGLLQIGQIGGTGDAAIWLRAQGQGRVIILAFAGVFSNAALGRGDNARLLANLIAWSRSPEGSVIFDDAHQGIVGYYDAKAFFRDPRLRRTLGWIVLLWFVFVLGVQRLRARSTEANAADVTAFIGTNGEFFAATLTPAAAAERLFGNFFNAIHARLGVASDRTAEWQWLARQAQVPASGLAELRRLHDRVRAGGAVDLVRLQNLLVQTQGNVS